MDARSEPRPAGTTRKPMPGDPPASIAGGTPCQPGGGHAGGIDRRRPGRMGMKASRYARALFLAPALACFRFHRLT